MPPKKNPKPNGFVIFAQDLQKQHGRKYSSLKEACDAAAPLWAQMSKDKRKPYDDRAREIKGQTHPTRYTSEGIDVEALTREEHLKHQAEEKARQHIRNNITLAHKGNALDTEVFFLIHCNIFCYHANTDRYWPAEIAVLSFTLKDGVKPENIFYYMVNPGPLPIGYKFEAQQHAEETHQIKLLLDDEATDNTEEVYFALKAFLEKKRPAGTKGMPILYADKKYIKLVQRILNCWASDYDDENGNMFTVYNLQVLFYFLRNIIAGEQIWPSITFSDRELEKDVYNHVPEIACQIHASTSRTSYCSKSIVRRYAYVICDNCCGDLNIECIDGQHVPLYSTVPDPHSSVYGGSRSSNSRLSRRGFDSDFETDSNADTWDTESLASNFSTSTVLSNLDDHFPSLGQTKRSSRPSNYGDLSSNHSSGKSYAGATNRCNLPNAFESDLSSGPSGLKGIGRGFIKKIYDSDSDVSVGTSNLTDGSISDYPPIGKGRGFRKRNL